MINDLNGAIGQIQNLLGELTGALQGQLDGLKGLLAQAETLSYKPVSDAVIAEIDDLKARLAAINPNALSDAEKLALTAALAVIEAIDLQTQVIGGLKSGYHSAEGEVRSILDQIAAALNQLRDKIGVFNPETILQPINGALEAANQLLDKVNARTLLAPLYAQIDTLRGMLEDLAPGRLLDPLQGAFDQALGLLNRLDPAQWVAPLNDLYAQIDRLISVVDITPVMDELDRKQRELLGKARDAVLNGFDALDLPEPLKGFTAEMRPIVELMTEALFGDPGHAAEGDRRGHPGAGAAGDAVCAAGRGVWAAGGDAREGAAGRADGGDERDPGVDRGGAGGAESADADRTAAGGLRPAAGDGAGEPAGADGRAGVGEGVFCREGGRGAAGAQWRYRECVGAV